ncbi:bifunctional aspartate kinase/homoserine dehydrogenase I [Balneolaceae bacterium ANBcel3]|nr:bifunctional aspartate kinase/homoserine dehydrogenase I [Balneolaceae bacterium ANBcel3]
MLRIVKFGGTSLYDVNRILKAAEIVKTEKEKAEIAVVVSALGGVTDELLTLMVKAREKENGWKDRFQLLGKRHLDTLEALGASEAKEQTAKIHELLNNLEQDLEQLQGELAISAKKSDRLVSYGERLSANIFSAALIKQGLISKAVDAQSLIRTNSRFGDADVDMATTVQQTRDALLPLGNLVPVVTGYIGSDANGQTTTLGRSGSDYSASILGEALDADEVQIWTDVNGVLTADPDIVPTAVTIPQLHYSEIAEMAHFGANVLHPRTVLPLQARNIPIRIKNTMNPQVEGTIISREYQATTGRLRSVSVKKDIVVVAVRSSGLDRVHELSFRALRALDKHQVPVFFNTAASSDYGITLVVSMRQADTARQALLEEFDSEFAAGLVDDPQVLGQVSMVTVIGEKLERDLGISGAVLSVLGENGIAPLAMAKGLANRHLSLLLYNSEAEMGVKLLNDHFCIHPHRVRLFVAGLGAIGGTLVDILKDLDDPRVDLSIIGACDDLRMAWNPSGIPPEEVRKRVSEGQPTDLSFILTHLIKEYPYRTVFVDATGTAEVARQYPVLLKAGIHVVTPSKRANSFEQEFFNSLMHYTVNKNTHYLYETTVGAGLPVIQTLKDLRKSGDELISISGAVSGTLSFIFSKLQEGVPFDEVVKISKERAISEPDPRDDLSGEDVVRKFMILARTAGYRLEREDIKEENLVPESFKSLTLDAFFEKLPELNQHWKEKVETAAEKGEVLRYVGHLEDGKITVGIKSVPKNSPLGTLEDTNNLISIRTRRYDTNPMIIQGPGAGKEVTAAGVLADIQKISRRLLK